MNLTTPFSDEEIDQIEKKHERRWHRTFLAQSFEVLRLIATIRHQQDLIEYGREQLSMTDEERVTRARESAHSASEYYHRKQADEIERLTGLLREAAEIIHHDRCSAADSRGCQDCVKFWPERAVSQP